MITKRAFCGVNRVTYRGMVLYSCNPLPWYRHSCNYKLMVQPDPTTIARLARPESAVIHLRIAPWCCPAAVSAPTCTAVAPIDTAVLYSSSTATSNVQHSGRERR